MILHLPSLAPPSVLSSDEVRRYARHIVLKGVGGTGQQRLKGARVLVMGAGGLGSPAIAYLAAAGIGTIGVIDDDTVSLSNLQRQIVHGMGDIGSPKTQSAEKFVAELNPHTVFNAHLQRFSPADAALFEGYDIVLDGSDNFATRADVATAARSARIILVSGAVSMFDGQVTVLAPHLADEAGQPYPDFTDLYPVFPDARDTPSCEATGVLSPLTGVIGSLMAMEAVKLITGVGEPLFGRLLIYDGKGARFSELTYGAGRS